MTDEYIKKCVTIRKDQEESLQEEKLEHVFMLSKFVQTKLDEFFKLRNEYKQFMEVKNEEKTG